MSVDSILSFTGHRPPKLGGYNDSKNYRVPVRDILREFLPEANPDLCIVGMALGFDQWVAESCIELNIPFDAYIPFLDYDARWPVASRRYYDGLLKMARNVIHLHSTPGADFGITAMYMQERNVKMVDDSNRLISLWNGTPGGTRNCVVYGRRVKKYNDETDNLWPRLLGLLGKAVSA